MTIDLRSDTVTKPTAAMLDAMMYAEVGDDVYGDDTSVIKLEQTGALMFGMEAALFCPSGTMTNQIAIKVHTQPGNELICADNSHVFKYEGGGMASNSGVQARIIQGNRGRITAEQIKPMINVEDVHFPTSKIVSLENTSNRGGGSIYDIKDIKAIRALCDSHSMVLHLDGARVFNALVECNYSAKDLGSLFHSISICLSKGLGAPVGSLLLGTKAFIHQARRVRKVFGGGMRQAGYLAAAGQYALDNNIERLKEDHTRAKYISTALKKISVIKNIMPVETNIVIFEFATEDLANSFMKHMNANNVMCGRISLEGIRFVFHLDIKEEMVVKLEQLINQFNLS